MVVHQVLHFDKRFQPLDSSVVDEMRYLLSLVKVRQALLLKVEGLQEQEQQLVLGVEKEEWDKVKMLARELLLWLVEAAKLPFSLSRAHSLIA